MNTTHVNIYLRIAVFCAFLLIQTLMVSGKKEFDAKHKFFYVLLSAIVGLYAASSIFQF